MSCDIVAGCEFRVINKNIHPDFKRATRNPQHLVNRQTNKLKKPYQA